MELNNRKIIQSFRGDTKVKGSVIDKLIDSFKDVNGAKKESWYLLFIYRRSIINEIAALSDNEDVFKGANTVIVVFSKKGGVSNIIDTSFAIKNMIDVAVENGLDAYFSTDIASVFNDPAYENLAEVCGVKKGYVCIGSVSVGYALDYKLEDKFSGDVFSIIL